MVAAFYEILDEVEPGGDVATSRLRATGHTTGPWSAGLQHAGPPAALLTRAVRRLTGLPDRALPARLAFDVLGPVPVCDLLVTATLVRAGRRIALADATLGPADRPGRPAMTLRAWLIRQLDPTHRMLDLPHTPARPAPAWPAGSQPMTRPPGWHGGYLDAVEWHWVEGSFEEPGPATVWTRLRVALVAGETLDPVEHLVTVADSASGISAVASPTRMLFVNTDLTLHLTRLPVGDAVWMRARTALDPVGTGRTDGELGDATGQVARSAQCLFVEPRT